MKIGEEETLEISYRQWLVGLMAAAQVIGCMLRSEEPNRATEAMELIPASAHALADVIIAFQEEEAK